MERSLAEGRREGVHRCPANVQRRQVKNSAGGKYRSEQSVNEGCEPRPTEEDYEAEKKDDQQNWQ